MSLMLKSSAAATSAAARRPAVAARAARAGNWLPGSDAPAHLASADLVGNYGFDPLNLAREPASLARFRESEVIHGRWAMLGVAGALAVEVLGFGNWYDAPLWAVNGGNATWFGVPIPFDLNTLLGIEFVAMAAAESRRGEAEAEKRVYPGGAFDPLGFAKPGSDVETLKLKELKNGRLVSERLLLGGVVLAAGFFASAARRRARFGPRPPRFRSAPSLSPPLPPASAHKCTRPPYSQHTPLNHTHHHPLSTTGHGRLPRLCRPARRHGQDSPHQPVGAPGVALRCQLRHQRRLDPLLSEPVSSRRVFSF
jgi:light-harvesting complex I chlorophyll a/b binding protein 1